MFIDFATDLTVTKVYSAVRLLNSPVGVTAHKQNRDRCALVLKKDGRTVYTSGGKRLVSDALHPMILPKGSSYSWECVESGECLIVEFDTPSECGRIIPLKIKDNRLLVKNFAKIELARSSGEVYSELECISYLYEMLLFCLRSGKTEYVRPQRLERLLPATEHIRLYYFDSGITNDVLARLCGMSTVYFRKSFTSAYGVSPIKYLHNHRIEKAKAILESDFGSVEQVALSVGYNSIYHFSKMFRQHTGMSPSEFARSNKTG